MSVTVKRQLHNGYERWGIYVNGELVEGGFTDHAAAVQHASMYNTAVATLPKS